jgi:hypothetical protein
MSTPSSSAAVLIAFRALDMPVPLMQGSETTHAARAVIALLARTLPRVET